MLIGLAAHVTDSNLLIGRLLSSGDAFCLLPQQHIGLFCSPFLTYFEFFFKMTKTGRKFHTLHKFGKRRRKKKVAKDIVSTQPDSQVSVESSEGPTPSTSTTGASSAWSRKLLFFKRKRQESDSEASDEEERGSDEPDSEPDLQGGSQNIAVIVDLNCLQSLILASGILCPHCNNQVS